jgi:hypothetical protein
MKNPGMGFLAQPVGPLASRVGGQNSPDGGLRAGGCTFAGLCLLTPQTPLGVEGKNGKTATPCLASRQKCLP